jgi:hypothetical protein
MPTETYRLSREELYTQVWCTPLTRLAPKYGLSDSGLRKVCIKHKIPLPKSGHWAKIRHGKKSPKPDLPTISDNENLLSTIIISKSKSKYPTLRKPPHVETGAITRIIEFENHISNRVHVKDILSGPHLIVSETKTLLKESRFDRYGRFVVPDKQCLYLKITPSTSKRALLILDALIRALETRPHVNNICRDNRPSSYVDILGETLRIELKERVYKLAPINEDPDWMFYSVRYGGTGVLTLSIVGGLCGGYKKSWTDTKDKPIEKCLNDFLIGLARAALTEKAGKLQREKENKIRQEEIDKRNDAKKRTLFHQAQIDRLIEDAVKFDKLLLVRQYISEIEKNRSENDINVAEGIDLNDWIEWANSIVDTNDPSKNFDFIKYEDFDTDI